MALTVTLQNETPPSPNRSQGYFHSMAEPHSICSVLKCGFGAGVGRSGAVSGREVYLRTIELYIPLNVTGSHKAQSPYRALKL